MLKRTVITTLAAITIGGPCAYAQDEPRIGVTMGYPATLGLIWHVSDHVAVRPGILFSRTSSESTSTLTFSVPGLTSVTTTLSTTESSTIGADMSVLLYLKTWDSVRVYVAPSYGYRQSTTTTTTTRNPVPLPRGEFPDSVIFGPLGEEGPRETSTYSHQIGGVFGVQYTPHRHFSVFGEVGVRYSQSRFGTLRSEASTIGNTTGAGVVFYF